MKSVTCTRKWKQQCWTDNHSHSSHRQFPWTIFTMLIMCRTQH